MARFAPTLLLMAVCVSACHARPPQGPRERDAGPHPTPELARTGDPPRDPPTSQPERAPYKPASTLAEPIAILRATAARSVYARPDPKSRERGRIQRGESFHVYAEQDGSNCKRAWAQVGDAAWICLEKTEPSEEIPQSLPHLEPGALLPFIYARHPGHDDPDTPPIPVYGSIGDYESGAAPHKTLPAFGSYAFTRLRPNRGNPVLITESRDVVAARELEVFEPSEFSGVDLREQPTPSGTTLAWAVRWKTSIFAAPDPTSEQRGRVRFHDPLFVVGDGVPGPDGEQWYEVARDSSYPAGWVSGHDVRRFVPLAPPEPILGGQVTIDVDLDEQVLSVWIEDRAVFATLISSGKINDETPPGLYRIETKRAYGKMQSLPSAREPYFVDAVPWTMYFDGRYALHAAFWHDMFGHRMSHGCVNLSPRDAKRVFEIAGPSLPGGWLLVHEHPADPGALVRVRRRGAALPDRRTALDEDGPGPSSATTD